MGAAFAEAQQHYTTALEGRQEEQQRNADIFQGALGLVLGIKLRWVSAALPQVLGAGKLNKYLAAMFGSDDFKDVLHNTLAKKCQRVVSSV